MQSQIRFMKLLAAISTCCLFFSSANAQRQISVQSPDGKISVNISTNRSLQYTVRHEENILLHPSTIDLFVQSGKLSDDLRIAKTTRASANYKITSPVPEKRKEITDQYNQVTIRFRGPFSIIFRAYNDGVAYRILTHFRDSITIKNETATFVLNAKDKIYFPVS